MSTVIVRPFALVPKDTNESRLILFDWDDENLAAVAAILLFVPRLAANVIGGALLVLLAARQWRQVPDARL